MTNGDDAPRGDIGRHPLKVDGDWGLLELANFGREYVQVYSFLHALNAESQELEAEAVGEPAPGPRTLSATDALPAELVGDIADDAAVDEQLQTVEAARLRHASTAYPWRGGWSAVNFFRNIVHAVPHAHSPRVARLEYSSPGSIELVLSVPIAEEIRKLVTTVAEAPDDVTDYLYKELHREARTRRLLGRHVKGSALRPDDSTFAKAASTELLSLMGLDKYQLQIVRLTDGNELAMMKIVFTLYRRIRVLARLQNTRKVLF